jgi:hypothetical protein
MINKKTKQKHKEVALKNELHQITLKSKNNVLGFSKSKNNVLGRHPKRNFKLTRQE